MSLTSAASIAGLGPTRRQVLATLQGRSTPVGIDELTDLLGLHANTLRFHLNALVRDGLATFVTENRTIQGRPRSLYTASPSSPAVNADHYLELAAMLVGYLRDQHPEPDPLLEHLGEKWGRALAEQADPAQDSLVELTGVVNVLGFTSRLIDAADGTSRLEITRCPYRSIADADPTVCRIHAGMMRGYLAAREAETTLLDLQPWVTPEMCVATFGPAAGPPSDPDVLEQLGDEGRDR